MFLYRVKNNLGKSFISFVFVSLGLLKVTTFMFTKSSNSSDSLRRITL